MFLRQNYKRNVLELPFTNISLMSLGQKATGMEGQPLWRGFKSPFI